MFPKVESRIEIQRHENGLVIIWKTTLKSYQGIRSNIFLSNAVTFPNLLWVNVFIFLPEKENVLLFRGHLLKIKLAETSQYFTRATLIETSFLLKKSLIENFK